MRTKQRLILEVNFIEQISVLKLADTSYYKIRILFKEIVERTLQVFTLDDDIIHYHTENLKNLSCAQVVSVQNQIKRFEIFT